MRCLLPVVFAALAKSTSYAAAQDRSAGDATAIREQFEIVRGALAAHGAITEYAPKLNGEIVSRRATLKAGRAACEWVLAIEAITLKRRVSAPVYRSTQTLPLAEIDPSSLKAHPIRERRWCCARSAEVEFAAPGGRQPFRTQAGESWYVSERVRIGFDDAGVAARAAQAFAEAVRLCRRPGA